MERSQAKIARRTCCARACLGCRIYDQLTSCLHDICPGCRSVGGKGAGLQAALQPCGMTCVDRRGLPAGLVVLGQVWCCFYQA